MGMKTLVQTLNEAVCISYSTKTPGNGMNPTILPTVMDKIVGQTGYFNHSLGVSL